MIPSDTVPKLFSPLVVNGTSDSLSCYRAFGFSNNLNTPKHQYLLTDLSGDVFDRIGILPNH